MFQGTPPEMTLGASWSGQYPSLSEPNNPVERTAHSARFFPGAFRCILWAAAHRRR